MSSTPGRPLRSGRLLSIGPRTWDEEVGGVGCRASGEASVRAKKCDPRLGPRLPRPGLGAVKKPSKDAAGRGLDGGRQGQVRGWMEVYNAASLASTCIAQFAKAPGIGRRLPRRLLCNKVCTLSKYIP